jgi:ethanolamine-phosphate cytidylyltransferase
MLLCTKTHFIRSLLHTLDGKEGPGSQDEKASEGQEMKQRIEDYATDETGLNPGAEVWYWHASRPAKERRVTRSSTDPPSLGASSDQAAQDRIKQEKGSFTRLVKGTPPRPGQSVVYVDGGFDLFSTGHIEFLRLVIETETDVARKAGWFQEEFKGERIKQYGQDYEPVYLIAGIHDDEVINYWKGVNYPIMNIFERGLCVLQCRYVHAVIFGAPFTPSKAFLTSLPYGTPTVVAHGPTAFMPLDFDPYATSREMGIFKEIGSHEFQHVNAGEIVDRIMKSRARFEERQRKKGEKAVGEEAVRKREEMEREAERRRHQREIEGMYGV